MTIARSAYLRGIRHALPFIIVMMPFATLFGVLAADAGLNLIEIGAFSLAVFGGASQFAALALLQDQAPVLVVLATAIAVNLRMVMYSVALSPHFGAAPFGIRAVMAYFLVDQSFALASAEFEQRREMTLPEKLGYFFGVVTPIAPLWMVFTVVGAAMGRAIPPQYALDFAVPITFLAITAPMIRTSAHGAAAIVAVGVTLALSFMPYGTGLLFGAAAGMAAGALWEYRAEGRAG